MFFKKRKNLVNSRNSNNSINLFNINVFLKDNFLNFNYNSLSYKIYIDKNFYIYIKNKSLLIISKDPNSKFFNCLLGTLKSIIYNVVFGFLNLYVKRLILNGIGYKFLIRFKYIYIYIGFSHPVVVLIPKTLKLEILSNIDLSISGFNKQEVNQFANFIKRSKKFDFYKGKGIKFLEDKLNLKEFKKK